MVTTSWKRSLRGHSIITPSLDLQCNCPLIITENKLDVLWKQKMSIFLGKFSFFRYPSSVTIWLCLCFSFTVYFCVQLSFLFSFFCLYLTFLFVEPLFWQFNPLIVSNGLIANHATISIQKPITNVLIPKT